MFLNKYLFICPTDNPNYRTTLQKSKRLIITAPKKKIKKYFYKYKSNKSLGYKINTFKYKINKIISCNHNGINNYIQKYV